MLQAGGAKVTLAGFRRTTKPASRVSSGIAPIDLGATRDGKFAQRLAAVAQGRAVAWRQACARCARSPISSSPAISKCWRWPTGPERCSAATCPIVYECLDIHRLLLRAGRASARRCAAPSGCFGRDAALLVTSSPAFVRNYFAAVRADRRAGRAAREQGAGFRRRCRRAGKPRHCRSAGEPWKIGWFGALRCRKSLELLAAFTRRMDGRFEVVLRGRPAHIPNSTDFDGFVAAEPHLRFEGAYRNPRGPRRDLRRGAFHLGDRLLRGRA